MPLRRLTTAFSLTLREFLRRRGMITLMALIPVFSFAAVRAALPRTPVVLDAVENGVKVQVELDQVALFGGVMALIYVALMAGIIGFYVMSSAARTDRRLILAGYSPAELIAARCLALLVLDVGILMVQTVIMLFFFLPQQLLPYLLSLFWGAMLYSFYGGLIAMLIRNELGGILAVVFFADIEIGYFQLPGYSTLVNEWWTQLLPGHFPVQLAIDAGFTAVPDLLLPSFWVIPQGLAIIGVMLAAYRRVTHVHPFLPEERRRVPWWAIGLALVALGGLVGGAGYLYWRGQPPVVRAEGRLDAPHASVVASATGRIRLLPVAEGDEIERGQVIAWIASAVDGSLSHVSAPLTGQVATLSVAQGENVVNGQLLAEIYQVAALEAVLEVDENSVQKVAEGQAVEVTFAALGIKTTSRVASIAAAPLPPEPGASEQNRKIRKYAVKCPLVQPDPRLRVGMAVKARIFTGEAR